MSLKIAKPTGAKVTLAKPTGARVCVTATEATPVDRFGIGSVSLLLHGNGANGSTTITDSSPYAVAVTANNGAAISTAEQKYGTGSIYLNGSTHSLTFADPQLATQDFTIECWLKTGSVVQRAQIIGNENASNVGFSFLINENSATGGQLAVYIHGNLKATSVAGDWSDNQWHHVALTRNGSSFVIWVDGSGGSAGTSELSVNGTATWYVGRNNLFPPRNLVGYIDDLRITRGIARYTANFTPPTAPFPDI